MVWLGNSPINWRTKSQINCSKGRELVSWGWDSLQMPIQIINPVDKTKLSHSLTLPSLTKDESTETFEDIKILGHNEKGFIAPK